MKWLVNRFERFGISSFPMVRLATARFVPSAVRFNARDFLWAALLISPLLAVSVWCYAAGRDYNVFWAGDESEFHYPLILRFAREWPRFNFNYGLSATTPLLHLLGATFVKFFGANVVTLRFCMTVISAVGILFVYRFLRNERGLSQFSSGVGAAVLMLSFYFFGYSFRVLTDNLALVFCLLAMGALYRFLSSPAEGMGAYFAGCVCLSLAVLTRQSSVFLCLPFVVSLYLRGNLSFKSRVMGLTALWLSLVPLVALFILWKGVVPPGSHDRHTPGGFPFYIHSMALPFCILGFYTLFFHAGEIWDWLKGGWRNCSTNELMATLALVALSSAGAVFLLGDNRLYSGFLNTVACQLPPVLGITVVTWLLLQVGLSAIFLKLIRLRWWRGGDPGEAIGLLSFAAICVVSTANSFATQKYYDAQVLACLVWSLSPDQADNRRWRYSMWLLISLFCVYQAARQSSLAYMAS